MSWVVVWRGPLKTSHTPARYKYTITLQLSSFLWCIPSRLLVLVIQHRSDNSVLTIPAAPCRLCNPGVAGLAYGHSRLIRGAFAIALCPDCLGAAAKADIVSACHRRRLAAGPVVVTGSRAQLQVLAGALPCRFLRKARSPRLSKGDGVWCTAAFTPPTVAATKEKFLQGYKKPIPPPYSTVIAELLVQQHFSRFGVNYEYNQVGHGRRAPAPARVLEGCFSCRPARACLKASFRGECGGLQPRGLAAGTPAQAARKGLTLVSLVLQIMALGFVSVFEQIMEAIPENERNLIFDAYIRALQENPEVYRRDAAAMMEQAKALGSPDQLVPSASGNDLQKCLDSVSKKAAAGKLSYNKFFAIGLFRMLELTGACRGCPPAMRVSSRAWHVLSLRVSLRACHA